VILEEIAMRDDDPADLVHDVFAEAVHGDTPLGRPIIGSVESITALSRASVKRFYDTRYDLPRMVVAASGGVEHDRLVELVTAAFAEKLVGEAAPAPLRASDGGPAPESRVRREERRTEQTHLVLGTTGLSREDPRRFALSVLSGALGGGMSSRLFQSVREERGLAYSVYSYAASSADTGQFGVYAGCSASKVGQVLSLVRDELAAVLDRGLTVEEVERAKGGLRGSLVLGLEDTGSRMTRLGKGELVHAEQLSPDDVLDRIAAVTPEEVADVAREVLTRPLSLGVVGPVGRADLDKAVA
jgi:predicted Zn-dependent peptidase